MSSDVSLGLSDAVQPIPCNVNDADRYQALTLVFIQSSHAWLMQKGKKEIKICLICFHERALKHVLLL